MAIAETTPTDPVRASLGALRRPVEVTDTTRRIQRLVAVFRLLVALALLAVASVDVDPPLVEARYPELFAIVAVAYAAFAIAALVLQWRAGGVVVQVAPAAQVLTDVAGVTLLMHAGAGISSGIGGLLVVLVGAASLSLQNRVALFAAAVSALAVLGEQGLAFSRGLAPASAFIPAGVLGAIIFSVAAAGNPLARRLRESEALAVQRGIDLANLAQLNDYVIQNLRESIVVVDDHDQVRLMNQSAADLLGVGSRAPGQPLRQIAPELYRTLRSWRRGEVGPDSTLGFPSAARTSVVNTYFAPLEQRNEGPVLMFLEDPSLLAEKVRQTKLVALGRLSASIAHEIRNPVGALSHAGQLLAESPAIGAQERRLLDIITTNSRRVSEIVENVLQLSRRDGTHPERIHLARWLNDFAAEFATTLELPEGRLRLTGQDPELTVRIDPGHLRQVCWNLCENALRYGGGDGGPAEVELSHGRMPGSRRPFLAVADRGPGIDTEMRERLFEPFATGRAGGIGLGLFISRELCECNRASLVHEMRAGGGTVFRVVFTDPERWSTAA